LKIWEGNLDVINLAAIKVAEELQKITIIDSTLRDGNHAIKHQITKEVYRDYARGAEKAGIPILVVGHGNGLGASSLHLGKSLVSDKEMLSIVKKELVNTKLAAFAIPGFATLSDVEMAKEEGVEILLSPPIAPKPMSQKST